MSEKRQYLQQQQNLGACGYGPNQAETIANLMVAGMQQQQQQQFSQYQSYGGATGSMGPPAAPPPPPHGPPLGGGGAPLNQARAAAVGLQQQPDLSPRTSFSNLTTIASGELVAAQQQELPSYVNTTPPRASTLNYGARRTLHPSELTEIGTEFVRQYYNTLSQEPGKIYQLYSSQSLFQRDNAPPLKGMMAIHKYILDQNYTSCFATITQLYVQPTFSDGLLIKLAGTLKINNDPPRRFDQTFLLGLQPTKCYYAHNDILTFLDNDTDALEIDRQSQQMAHSLAQQVVPPAQIQQIEVVQPGEPSIQHPQEFIQTLTTLGPVVQVKRKKIRRPKKPPIANGLQPPIEAPSEIESLLEHVQDLESYSKEDPPPKYHRGGNDCNICHKNVTSVGKVRHIMRVHLKQPILKCVYCSFAVNWSDKGVIERHQKQRHKGYPPKYHDRRKLVEEEIETWIRQCFGTKADAEEKRKKKIRREFPGDPLRIRRPRKKKNPAERKEIISPQQRRESCPTDDICKLCDRPLPYGDSRKVQHIFECHLGEDLPIICPYCDFGKKWNLNEVKVHVQKCHPDETLKVIDQRYRYRKEVEQVFGKCFTGEMNLRKSQIFQTPEEEYDFRRVFRVERRGRKRKIRLEGGGELAAVQRAKKIIQRMKKANCRLCDLPVVQTDSERVRHLLHNHFDGKSTVRCPYCSYGDKWRTTNITDHIHSLHVGEVVRVIDERWKYKEDVEKLFQDCFGANVNLEKSIIFRKPMFDTSPAIQEVEIASGRKRKSKSRASSCADQSEDGDGSELTNQRRRRGRPKKQRHLEEELDEEIVDTSAEREDSVGPRRSGRQRKNREFLGLLVKFEDEDTEDSEIGEYIGKKKARAVSEQLKRRSTSNRPESKISIAKIQNDVRDVVKNIVDTVVVGNF